MANAKKQDKPTVIKKYANRRLYDTGRSSYVTLDDLCIMVKEGHEFVVYDAKSGEDLTRSVLTQIIVDQESSGGESMLPISFLRQLIGFYGDKVQSAVPNYLEQSMEFFTHNQERLREHITQSFANSKQGMKTFEGMFTSIPGFSSIEEMNRKNLAIFERAMQAFSPFAAKGAAGGQPAAEEMSSEDKIREIKKAISEMEKELSRLSEQD